MKVNYNISMESTITESINYRSYWQLPRIVELVGSRTLHLRHLMSFSHCIAVRLQYTVSDYPYRIFKLFVTDMSNRFNINVCPLNHATFPWYAFIMSYQEDKSSYLCVFEVSNLPLSKILIFDLWALPTLYYSIYFISLVVEDQYKYVNNVLPFTVPT
jgi:hypothetical protein